ncbi:spartin [Marchantia polymorpha subsp. ruderalis]|uniref:Senescence domain-containing protein n=2 Tax=Marchantia polymorpha TaxID=3197 RepID=A0AAF6BUY2_MARPO|nr:hypothetical protein MARPO_0046s0014 [Marchantia polymorpha]BBN15816.1 hypothetical protein Mp_7g01100 [Marchantia polymorpha subsp. ruderalis]|eukprot:PTQ39190.1 hypothetical protein MARPO_0046s0014 [Marchantia polymorpha]
MDYLKDKASRLTKGAPGQQNFKVGSSNWLGNSSGQPSPTAPMGSFKNPESAQNAAQNDGPNPYLLREPVSPPAPPTSGIESMSLSAPPENKLYPDLYKPPGADGEEVEVLIGEQVLLTIPGVIVHLIDGEKSPHLGSGDFQLIRFVQEKTKVVVIAKVGDDLMWPLVQEMSTVKLSPTQYYFSLKVPKDLDPQVDSSSSDQGKNHSPLGNEPGQMETLNYGVTFRASSSDDQNARFQELDTYLERYSTFSAPTIVQKDGNTDVKELDQLPSAQDPEFPGKVVPAETLASDGKMMTEETSAEFWTTIAPNVDDYNSKAAKGIATGAGHVIRGILWLSDATVQQLDSGHGYMKAKFKPKADPSKISPTTIANMRRVRKMTGMTDKVAKGVLGGIVYTTGLFSSAVINSPPGKAFFKLLPGEVALVSLDAFGRVFDAVEKAGTDVMSRSSSVTQDFVNYRYGEAAKELTEEVNKTAGNVTSTVWTFTKIRKAFNPKNFVSKTGMLKAAAQQVAVNKKV